MPHPPFPSGDLERRAKECRLFARRTAIRSRPPTQRRSKIKNYMNKEDVEQREGGYYVSGTRVSLFSLSMLRR